MDPIGGSMGEAPIVVTGASGFVGRYLLRALLDAGYPSHQIVSVTQSRADGLPDGIRQIVIDFSSRLSVGALMRECNPAAVVHLAAIAEPAKARSSPDRAWNINFDAVRLLCEEILSNCPAARFLFVGSSEAYGASFLSAEGPVIESTALRPISTYGATKAAADMLVGQMAWQGLRAVRFRPFNHTGAGQSPNYVVSSFATQVAMIEAGRQPPVLNVGNLNASRDFLDVRDVVQAYVMALTAQLDFATAPVFNLATSAPVQISSILSKLLSLSDAKIEVVEDPERMRATDILIASGSGKAAENMLNWSPRIDLDQTLSHMLAALRREVKRGD